MDDDESSHCPFALYGVCVLVCVWYVWETRKICRESMAACVFFWNKSNRADLLLVFSFHIMEFKWSFFFAFLTRFLGSMCLFLYFFFIWGGGGLSLPSKTTNHWAPQKQNKKPRKQQH